MLKYSKSQANWEAKNGLFKPAWTDSIGITWIEVDNVDKLYGSTFGMNLIFEDVYTFLLEKTPSYLRVHKPTSSIGAPQKSTQLEE